MNLAVSDTPTRRAPGATPVVPEKRGRVGAPVRRVLVVDDEENLRHMLQLMLRKEGYDTVGASNVDSALAELEAASFDIVLTDLRMPGRNGMELVDEIRRRRLACTLVVMTAYGSRDVAIEALKRGAYDYLSKPFDSEELILLLRKAEERERAKAHLQELGINCQRPIIGLNTGAGRRWELKQWREEGYVELIEHIAKKHSAQFLLLGGPEERERHKRLIARSRVPLIDAGCDNSVRHFASLVGECHLVITGDTLAMHISLALNRRTIVLFGPTSAAEIEMYGLGEKVVPRMECLSCYKPKCDFVPNCMELISTEMVESAVERQWEKLCLEPNGKR